MRRYYEKLRHSGTECLGEIPAHWKVRRGRFCMAVNPLPETSRQLPPEAEVSFVPMEAIGEHGGLDLSERRPLAEIGSGYTPFQNDDVIVAKITPCFENGKGALAVGLCNGAAFGTTELHVLRASSVVDRRYLFYLTLSVPYRRTGEAEMYGAGGQKRVPPEFNKDFPTPLPPLLEQAAIADFLDRKTAEIDTLLAKKRALIEKLKEKRSALISRAVTRGLPREVARAQGIEPAIRLRVSGIEYLGDIPGHWLVKKLGRLTEKIGSGKTPKGGAETYQSEGVLLIRSQNVHSTGLKLEDAVFIDQSTDEDMAGTRVIAGDVLLNITGASLGRCAVAPKDLGRANVNQHVCIIRLRSECALPAFVGHAISSQPLQSQIFSFEAGSSREGLNFQQVRGLFLAVPPLPEQLAIADFLDRETAKIDALVAKVEQAIERFQEYRTALITAAVTGKIDVRQEQSGLTGLDGQAGQDGHAAKAGSRPARRSVHA